MTNAEKIKNMTIEELATMLSQDALWRNWLHPEYCGIVAEGDNPGFCDDDCYECVLEWLKQEAKEKKEKPKQIEICIENENGEFEPEGYYGSIDDAIQALQNLKEANYSLDYEMYCPYGLYDCIYDPGYLIKSCPKWYKELYGDNSPEEAVKIGCLPYCKNGSCYDDEDK